MTDAVRSLRLKWWAFVTTRQMALGEFLLSVTERGRRDRWPGRSSATSLITYIPTSHTLYCFPTSANDGFFFLSGQSIDTFRPDRSCVEKFAPFSIGRTVRSIFIHFNFVPFPENPITANRHQNAIHTPRNFPALSKRKWFDWSEREGRGWEFERFPPATARLFLFWIKRVRLVPTTTTTLERESELEKRKVS